jgi:hypothetical protein
MKLTQGARLAAGLKIGPATYMQMLSWGISVCPWKRIEEWLALRENRDWKLDKMWTPNTGQSGPEFLTTWRLVRKPKGVD